MTDVPLGGPAQLPKQRYPQLTGMSLSRPVSIYQNDLSVLLDSVLTRVFNHKVDGEWRPIAEFRPKSKAFSVLDTFLEQLVVEPVRPMSRIEFLQHCPKDKIKLYQDAVESLITKQVCEEDAFVKPFPKVEKSLKDVYNGEFPDPRVILPRTPRYNVEYGRFICAIEKRIFQAIDNLMPGRRTVMKGLNVVEVAAVFAENWACFGDPVAVQLDASRFDQHVSVAAMLWKHRAYRKFLDMNEEEFKLFSWLCRQQLSTTAKAKDRDHKLRFKSKGGLCSGDIDTSATAVLLVCAMFYTFLEKAGVDYRFVDNGDDCVVIMDRSSLYVFDDLSGFMEELGFLYRIDGVVDILEQVKFCQCHPVYEGHNKRYVMVRDPNDALAKDTVIVKSGISFAEECGIYKAIAQGGLSLYGDMPLYHAFYSSLYEHYGGAKCPRYYPGSYMMRTMSVDVKVTHTEPHELTRLSFYRAFGVSPGRQLEVEAMYNRPLQGETEIWYGHLVPDCLIQML